MKQISQHISYLLLTCRKVTVPGLGLFSTRYEKASFDPADGVFYPAHIRVIFLPDKREDTSLLLSLTRKLKISEEEAEAIINKYKERVLEIIEKNRYCRIDGIGYLMTDYKGNLTLKDTFWKKHKFQILSSML